MLGKNPTAAQIERFSNELHVTAQTPPTYLTHTGDDAVVDVENSILFYQALRPVSYTHLDVYKRQAYITAPARYVVLGVLTESDENKGTANYDQVVAINEKLATKYGKAFVKMTPPTDAEMKAISYTPTAEDLTDLANLNFPRGLRADINTDKIHLNDKGYLIIANRVIEKLKELKY